MIFTNVHSYMNCLPGEQRAAYGFLCAFKPVPALAEWRMHMYIVEKGARSNHKSYMYVYP